MTDWREISSFRGSTLEAHVIELLKQGKRSDHDDFKLLFRTFGREKIISYAKKYLSGGSDAEEKKQPSL